MDRVGGATVRIGDCHIWAAIQYLDSSSDYRDHIPNRAKSNATGKWKVKRKQLVTMLRSAVAMAAFLTPIILLIHD